MDHSVFHFQRQSLSAFSILNIFAHWTAFLLIFGLVSSTSDLHYTTVYLTRDDSAAFGSLLPAVF